jgi:hypothetical protein
VALQPTNGTVINIPAGTVCSGNFFFPEDTNAAIKTFSVSGSTLTANGHGYNNGQAAMVTGTVFCNFPIKTGCSYLQMPTPLVTGEIYYIANATTNTFQLSLTAGGRQSRLPTPERELRSRLLNGRHITATQ